MKKYLIILLVVICLPFSVNALEIGRLGFKSDDIKDLTIETRDTSKNSYYNYVNNIYATGENDRYIFYLRAVENPIEVDYEVDKDIIDEVFGLLSLVNTNEYSYINSDQYKWIRFKYKTKQDNIPLIEYFLSWKDIFFTITFQGKDSEISSDDEQAMDLFVKSIKIDGKGKVEVSHVYEDGIDTKPTDNYTFIIIESIICVFAIVIAYYCTRKKI